MRFWQMLGKISAKVFFCCENICPESFLKTTVCVRQEQMRETVVKLFCFFPKLNPFRESKKSDEFRENEISSKYRKLRENNKCIFVSTLNTAPLITYFWITNITGFYILFCLTILAKQSANPNSM
jgi:hypothetical protein